MPLAGGASAKAGLRYEYLWTVRCMVRVLRGEADLIHLEPTDPSSEGVEFYLETPSGIEYHQVKRQLTGKGVWSLAQLESRGVLSHFNSKLDDPTAACFFVSSHAAHPLDELANRARDASSWEVFRQDFISSQEWSNNFSQLHEIWRSSTQEDTYQRLKRIRVRTEDEESLREKVELGLETQIAENPANILSALLDYASNQIHQELSAEDILAYLDSLGFTRQTWVDEPSVADAVSELTQTYMAGIQPVEIVGKSIPRKEIIQILDTFDGEHDENTVLVSGVAGVGKTSAISQALAKIMERDWPVLALRIDRMEPAATPGELGKALGLPASPVSVLDAVAKGRECLLVLDQLDAVSLASGRHPEFFDCIGVMLSQAQSFPNMKVLSACRKFDIENDHRLRDLVGDGGLAKEVPVQRFDEETVRSLVAGMGLDESKLTPRQIELLSLPIHLRLLSETEPAQSADAMGFQTAKDLYDRFWDYKRNAMRSRVGTSLVHGAVKRIVGVMTQRQALSIPASALDEYHAATSVLVSENILVRDGPRISFFHESFYDYLFAREFVSDGLDLVSHILDQDQSLFVRSQVRQVLLHQRDMSAEDFSRNMEDLLTRDSIRPHLKSSVLSLLSLISDPNEEEWGAVDHILESDLSGYLWGAIRGSTAWFDLLDRTGQVQQWLESGDEETIRRAVWYLSGVQEDRAGRTAELLMPFVGTSESWNRRLADFFVRSDATYERGFFDFVLKLVESGALDDALHPGNQSDYVWYPIRDIGRSNPEWICELIAAYFERSLTVAEAFGGVDPFPTLYHSHQTAGEVVTSVADIEPEAFVKKLLPFLAKVAELNVFENSEPPRHDKIWGYGIVDSRDKLADKFLAAMESALGHLSINHPDQFEVHAEVLRKSEYHTLQALLVHAYAAAGESFADTAVEYLLEDPSSRLEIDQVSTSSDYPIRQLLQSVTPHCSDKNMKRLEEAILEYYPAFERDRYGRARWGSFQLALLDAVKSSRLSERGVRRLQELHRKFGDVSLSGLPRIESGIVGSPIPKDSSRRMSDDQWLRAIERYPSDAPSNGPGTFLRGGAIQLSQLLETHVKDDSLRFAELAHRISDDANPAYFGAILRGVEDSNLDMDVIVSLCLRCHRIPGHPLGMYVTRPLERFGDAELPDEVLNMVAWYATEHPEPDPAEISSNVRYSQGGQDFVRYDPLSVGINSVRGTAAGTVAKLVFRDERYLTFFKPHLQTMVNDPSDAVRSCVAEALIGVLVLDRDLAVELFLKLCNDERLMATHHVETFLRYATQTHFGQLEPLISQMIESEHDSVATAGARWACYASLSVEDAEPLARRCVAGNKAQRLGAAGIYSVNVKVSSLRSVCEEMLSELFSDPDPDVQQQAARCFQEFRGRDLRDYVSLAESYIDSPAFDAEHNPLFYALEESTANVPGVILKACDRVFELTGAELSDMSTGVAGTSGSMVKLVTRVYSRATDPAVKSHCLDIIDRMTVLAAYGLDTIAEEFDREI